MHVVIQDPSLVVRASHECLVLFRRTNSEPLVVDALESAIDHTILLTLSLENTLVQINVLHTHSLTIDSYVSWKALCRIVYHIILINQTIHLGSEPHELGDTMPVVFILEDRSRQFLVEIEGG